MVLLFNMLSSQFPFDFPWVLTIECGNWIGGGTLDREELREVLKKMGKNLTDTQLTATMNQVDEDGSGEVELGEFETWWEKYMSSEAAVPPTPFNFGGQCVRALKINGSEAFWWVASDVANVLFPPEPTDQKLSKEQVMAAKKAEQKKLRQIWKKVDVDGSGELDWDELREVFRMMGRELSDKEMDKALNEIDRDGGGEVDFDEFVKWWNKQDAGDKMIMEKQKAFESLLDTFQAGDITSILLATPSGPEDAKLVSPQGLFRLVLRAKSTRAKDFHEWAERMAATASRKPAGGAKLKIGGDGGGAGDGASAKILLDRLPKVDAIWEDFATRNLIVEMATNDDWFFHKKEAVGLSGDDLLAANDLKIYTMTMDAAPQFLCVKGYLKFNMSPSKIAAILWPETKSNRPTGVGSQAMRRYRCIPTLDWSSLTVCLCDSALFGIPCTRRSSAWRSAPIQLSLRRASTRLSFRTSRARSHRAS